MPLDRFFSPKQSHTSCGDLGTRETSTKGKTASSIAIPFNSVTLPLSLFPDLDHWIAMPRPSRTLSDNESDVSSDDIPAIFSANASDDDTDTDSAPSDSDFDSEVEDESEDESEVEEELSPEYFLKEAEFLDVSQLRQKRYSPKTEERLDETRDYWER
jgi:hypothetical protein